MAKINVEPTAEVIDQIAADMEHFAKEVRRMGKHMREREDLTYAAEAINTIRNCFANLRTDLLVTRPMREINRFNSELLENLTDD